MNNKNALTATFLLVNVDVKSIKVSDTVVIAVEYVMTLYAFVFSFGFSHDLDFTGRILIYI